MGPLVSIRLLYKVGSTSLRWRKGDKVVAGSLGVVQRTFNRLDAGFSHDC